MTLPTMCPMCSKMRWHNKYSVESLSVIYACLFVNISLPFRGNSAPNFLSERLKCLISSWPRFFTKPVGLFASKFRVIFGSISILSLFFLPFQFTFALGEYVLTRLLYNDVNINNNNNNNNNKNNNNNNNHQDQRQQATNKTRPSRRTLGPWAY